MEIIQPEHIVVPDRHDPRAWEILPIVYEEWARNILPQFGLNEAQVNDYILGHIVGTFLYDDGNCFAKGGRDEDWYYEVAHDMQRQLTTRLNWEINSGVLPEGVSFKLSELLDYVNTHDWNDYANMIESCARWRYVRMELETRIYQGGDLEEVYTYFLRTNKMVQDFWGEFIKSRL